MIRFAVGYVHPIMRREAGGSAGEIDDRSVIEAAMTAVREQLGMDVAYLARLGEGHQHIEQVEGAEGAFGLARGQAIPLEETYCARMTAGTLPNVIPDTRADQRVARLPITSTAGIGAYVGVPVRLPSGRIYGTFCCLSREPNSELRERDARFVYVVARLVADHLTRRELEREARALEVEASGFAALLAALDARDSYTGNHSEAVVGLAGRVARALGLAEPSVREVEQVALIHDVGKLGIPDAILRKPGALTDEEWVVMRTHPTIGAEIVASVPAVAHLAPAVRAEHERFDGHGYPDGLAGDAIPCASRIVLACDAWHAMRSDRPYRRAMEEARAQRELLAGAGTQFCPKTVDALLSVLAEPATGLGGAGPDVMSKPRTADAPPVVGVAGEISTLRTGALSEAIDEALSTRPEALFLDLAETTFVDSHGLAFLAQVRRRCQLQGTRLVLSAPSAPVVRVLRAAGLDSAFEIDPEPEVEVGEASSLGTARV